MDCPSEPPDDVSTGTECAAFISLEAPAPANGGAGAANYLLMVILAVPPTPLTGVGRRKAMAHCPTGLALRSGTEALAWPAPDEPRRRGKSPRRSARP